MVKHKNSGWIEVICGPMFSGKTEELIRRLVRDGYVESKPYRSIFLTEKGKALAKYCKKRHDIVYNFLISIGVDIETAKMDAMLLATKRRTTFLKKILEKS